MSSNNPEENLELTISRLYSQDANDRVKAAAELGEEGTPEVAPKLLEVAYEDEASTVRQMAIQSYSEILGEESIPEIIRAADEHFDDYVKMYAIMVLGRVGGDQVGEPLSRYIRYDNTRLQAAAVRAMIHAETSSQADEVFDLLRETDETILVRNSIEALALWKYHDAKDYIKSIYFNDEDANLEIKTISAFYLASIDDKDGKKYLENERVDSYIRIKIDDTHYRGNKGLLEAASRI